MKKYKIKDVKRIIHPKKRRTGEPDPLYGGVNWKLQTCHSHGYPDNSGAFYSFHFNSNRNQRPWTSKEYSMKEEPRE